jgi:aspartyl-tRNA(Asn)/glutamyl-tRNA(Gln) amidotransferase subunit A
MGPLAVGTDGGGSIRIPCSFTGLFGIKPSFGRVPAWPLSPFGTVAHVGPMTRTVTDAALMLNVLAQPDARVVGQRIAYSPDLGYAKVDAEVRKIIDDAVAVFSELGANVERKDPGFPDPAPIFTAHWFSGAAFLMKGVKNQELVDPGLREVAAQGAKITAEQLLEAQMKRGALGLHMNLFHRDYDLLVTPTLSIAAFDAGKEVADKMLQARWTDWTPFSFPFNLTQQPAASIPCGLTKAGLPVGLHLVGPRYADALVLRAARAFETARPIVMPKL